MVGQAQAVLEGLIAVEILAEVDVEGEGTREEEQRRQRQGRLVDRLRAVRDELAEAGVDLDRGGQADTIAEAKEGGLDAGQVGVLEVGFADLDVERGRLRRAEAGPDADAGQRGVEAVQATVEGGLSRHEDGLADIADAFVGGWSIEDRLRILKDPLHGSYGVAALCGSIVLRIAALGSMKPQHMFVAAIVSHCLARTGALVLMLTTALARHDGLGADYVRTLPIARAFLGIIFALVIGFIALDVWLIAAVVATIVGASVIRWWAQRKIGGITGDVLGAAEQISEALIYVALCAR